MTSPHLELPLRTHAQVFDARRRPGIDIPLSNTESAPDDRWIARTALIVWSAFSLAIWLFAAGGVFLVIEAAL